MVICQVLEEMRACCRVLDFSRLPALIEDVQYMANRMEEALNLQKDIDWKRSEYKELKRQYKELEARKEALEDEIAILEDRKKEVCDG